MPVIRSHRVAWPYPIEWNKTERLSADVLVLGGGAAGCFAAISAAKKGARVILVEKAATISSGAGGSGCDHWESAATNPCSRVSPDELVDAMIRSHDGYNNGISHYIECREGWDRLSELEQMGAKIRDSEGEFKGAEFRDEETKLLFAYDYVNRFTLRVWGTTFKQALYRECKRLGVQIVDRTMANGLLTESGKIGRRIVGAVGVNARTGRFLVIAAKASILCMSRPTRLWLFSPAAPGLSEFRPPQCTGDGHAMGWRVGLQFTMMEKSVKGEWSGTRSFPPYGTGNNHNTWYACSMVDAEGREIPWADRDGRILTSVSDRYRPAPGQKFFLKGGGEPDFPFYQFQGPETLPVDELLKLGYKLPLFADLSRMPEHERRVIWGMMVGQEGKSKVPILEAYRAAGFDPEHHVLQSYGDGWKSGSFLPQERQLFGLPGGVVNDWHLMTNLEGLFAAGDVLFASNCFGHAAATGHYAGRHAAQYAAKAAPAVPDEAQVEMERRRIYQPLQVAHGICWQELNAASARLMQHYCGGFKSGELLRTGQEMLQELQSGEGRKLCARNPHELVRSLEVLNVLTNAEIVLHACLARLASSRELQFTRLDYPALDPPEWRKLVTVTKTDEGVKEGFMPIDYYGPLAENYERNNRAYLDERRS
jgi:succinate dehydrogenase/fumarate reductase flavoprotein subunit